MDEQPTGFTQSTTGAPTQAQGHSSQEIGDTLGLSAKTVETYHTRMLRKLNLHHRSDLAQYALRTGLPRPRASL